MNCQPVISKAYLFSNWVPAWLPIQYNLTSDKWPINTFDDIDSVASIADDNGFARITLSSTSETYINREYIKITNSSTYSGYDGVWQIITLNSSTDITISAPYLGNDTANFQRYYQGYYVSAKVYAGIPSGHTHEAKNPISQIGTLRTKPNTLNNAIVDISSYVRAELGPIKNDLCTVIDGLNGFHGNDYNLWTAFYIEYAEAYLVSDGTNVSEFVGEYTTDMVGYDTNLQYATRSALQFQDRQGRSVGRFVVDDTDPDTAQAQFMTNYETPTYFLDKEFDLSIGINLSNTKLAADGYGLEYVLKQYDSVGNLLDTDESPIDQEDQGVYRFAFSEYPLQYNCAYFTFLIQRSTGEQISEEKRVNVDRTSCTRRGDIYLRWLNIYGGFDGFWFNRNHDYKVNVTNREIVRRNIYKNFDDEFTTGDTQDDYYSTTAKEEVVVRSAYLTESEADNMKWLLTSNKVYECFTTLEESCTRYKKRTVLIQPENFLLYSDKTKLKKASFTFQYTDEMILPAQ